MEADPAVADLSADLNVEDPDVKLVRLCSCIFLLLSYIEDIPRKCSGKRAHVLPSLADGCKDVDFHDSPHEYTGMVPDLGQRGV